MPSGVYKHKKKQGFQKGYIPSKEHREKMGISRRGKPLSLEHRKNISLALKGDKAYNWKGGIKDNRHKGWSMDYKIWRSAIFERDNWTCQTCGLRGVKLEAHHIKSWARYPELRYELGNGVALCCGCHKLTDNYKGKLNKHEYRTK